MQRPSERPAPTGGQARGFVSTGRPFVVTLQVGVPLADHTPEFSAPGAPSGLELRRGAPTDYEFQIRLLPDNRLHVELPRMPFGHGIANESARIVSEVLDVSMDRIDTSLSPSGISSSAIGSSTLPVPGTEAGAATELLDPLRRIAAEFRALLVLAAARELGVTTDAVTTHDGHAIAPDGRSLAYASVVVSGLGDVEH